MSDFQLRPFQWSDIPAITTIYRHYVENTAITFDTEAPGEEAIAEKYAGLQKLGPLVGTDGLFHDLAACEPAVSFDLQ